jgi:hypothetical protein
MLDAQHGAQGIAVRPDMRSDKDGFGLTYGRNEILKNDRTPYFVL